MPMIIATCIVVFLILFFGWPHKIDASHKKIYSGFFKKRIRICVISDLHTQNFGKNNIRILRMVHSHRPDLIVFPGDIFTPHGNNASMLQLMHACNMYERVYISGNHDELLKEKLQELIVCMKADGVHVLQNDSEVIRIGNQALEFIGLSDSGAKMDRTLAEVDSLCVSGYYRILLSHRPHYIDFYSKLPVNLIISGHAHGGQWALPLLRQGLFAPQQGLFPKYTHGIRNLDGRLLYISRGLASGNKWIIRLFNNPEIGFIDLLPKDEKR